MDAQISLGKQIWTTENLTVTQFANGDEIPFIKSKEDWQKAYREKRPAYCYYQNDKNNIDSFGLLYNWYAITDPRGLAPEGWRIPSDDDWQELVSFLGGYLKAGKRIKSIEHWQQSPYSNTNSSELNVLPAGYRNFYGDFFFKNKHAYFWSTTEHYDHLAWYHTMDFMMDSVVRYYNVKGNGFPIRCVKNK